MTKEEILSNNYPGLSFLFSDSLAKAMEEYKNQELSELTEKYDKLKRELEMEKSKNLFLNAKVHQDSVYPNIGLSITTGYEGQWLTFSSHFVINKFPMKIEQSMSITGKIDFTHLETTLELFKKKISIELAGLKED